MTCQTCGENPATVLLTVVALLDGLILDRTPVCTACFKTAAITDVLTVADEDLPKG